MTGAKTVSVFERFDHDDVRALIAAYPLAWLCGGEGAAIEASRLPLIALYDEAGALTELIGHMTRVNPLHALLSARPAATILFNGPDAYVSPEHAGRRDWAPTWNYAQLRIGADVHLDESLTEYSLRILIDAMEQGRVQPWHERELGPRYHGMLGRIIGFRARVTSLSGRFKLGQDEAPGTLDTIMQALPDGDVVEWMTRMNQGATR